MLPIPKPMPPFGVMHGDNTRLIAACRQMAGVVSLLCASTSLSVLAQPNAGKPRLADGRTVFEMAPAAFAAGIAECLRAGATLVGGCCGTTAEHIRAVAAVLAGQRGA